jgi:Ca2+-transporting ATPase
MGAATLFTQAAFLDHGYEHWQTMVFTTLTLAQMSHLLAIRSWKESLFTQGLFTNVPLVAAVVLTYVLQLAVIYVPFMQEIFKTQRLTSGELLLCLVVSASVFLAVEAEKWVKRKSERRR